MLELVNLLQMDLNKRAFNIAIPVSSLIHNMDNTFQSDCKSVHGCTRDLKSSPTSYFCFDLLRSKKKELPPFSAYRSLPATNIFRDLVRFVIKTSYRVMYTILTCNFLFNRINLERREITFNLIE